MLKQSNPYELEKVGLRIKLRILDGDQSYLSKHFNRSRITIEEFERVMERLSHIDGDIQKWEAIHKAKELKEYFNKVDIETKNKIKFELNELCIWEMEDIK